MAEKEACINDSRIKAGKHNMLIARESGVETGKNGRFDIIIKWANKQIK